MWAVKLIIVTANLPRPSWGCPPQWSRQEQPNRTSVYESIYALWCRESVRIIASGKLMYVPAPWENIVKFVYVSKFIYGQRLKARDHHIIDQRSELWILCDNCFADVAFNMHFVLQIDTKVLHSFINLSFEYIVKFIVKKAILLISFLTVNVYL